MMRILLRFQPLSAIFLLATISATAQQVAILSPQSGTIVTPGQTLSVVVSVSNGTVAGVLVTGEDLGVSSAQSSPPYSVTLSIPSDVVGVKNLTAFAIIGPEQAVISLPVSIDIEPDINVTMLSSSISSIQFGYIGDQYPLNILGTMSDKSLLDLTRSARIVYSSSDNAIASVDTTGHVNATGAGTASITATYGTQTVSVPVTVPAFLAGDLDGDGQVTPDDMAILETFVGQNASGPADARDLNSDGVIDLVDLQKLQSLCGIACAGAGLPVFVTTVGTGTVSSTPPGIACPVVCTASFPLGAKVNLTANTAGPNFAGWSGACTGLGSCSISTDSVQSVTATFLAASTDTTPPVTTAGVSPSPNANGWNNANVTVNLDSTDHEQSGTGVKQITYSAAGAQTIASTNVSGSSTSFPISTEGITTITFFGTDNAGNVETAKTITVKIDRTAPTITGVRTPAPNEAGWNNTNVTASFTCSDALSGLAAGSPPAPTTLSTEGTGQVTATCTDVAGNSASATLSGINIDKTPPTVACSASPDVLWPPNNKLVPINVSVNASDALSGPGGFTLVSARSNEPDSGQGDIQGFMIGSASTNGQLRARRLGIGTGRVYTLTYTGSDRAGNTTTCTATISVPHDQGQN